jgi:hypothetical protein
MEKKPFVHLLVFNVFLLRIIIVTGLEQVYKPILQRTVGRITLFASSLIYGNKPMGTLVTLVRYN